MDGKSMSLLGLSLTSAWDPASAVLAFLHLLQSHSLTTAWMDLLQEALMCCRYDRGGVHGGSRGAWAGQAGADHRAPAPEERQGKTQIKLSANSPADRFRTASFQVRNGAFANPCLLAIPRMNRSI